MTGLEENVKKKDSQHLIPLRLGLGFFQKYRRVTFFTLLALTLCKVSEKNNERSPRYLKTDRRTGQLKRAITMDPIR